MKRMTSLSQLHDRAMDHAAKGDLARMMGNNEEAQVHIREALRLERLAAEMVRNRVDLEPSRSILFRSAASLALENGDLREAERLAAMGLYGNPPDEIADELRDVLERANFHRHLNLQGYVLLEDEFQISLAGDNVADGIAEIEEVVPRAESTVRLLYRTAQRKSGKTFSDKFPKALRQRFQAYMAVPRAASFAITIRFAENTDQECMPGFSLCCEVVDELLTCTEMLAANQIRALKERILETAYFLNFLRLAEKIAPDGRKIRTVGFTATRSGTERRVNLQIPRAEVDRLAHQEASPDRQEESVEVEGTLLLANSLSRQDQISIRDAKDEVHKVIVPEGLMDDIVRPHWNRRVRVKGIRRGKEISLSSIEQQEE
ncbi:MAG: hypothetical protein AB1646_03480 [Thermodesulfobacteriota bacterium]